MPHHIKNSIRAIYSAIPLKKAAFSILKSFWSPPESIYRHLWFDGVFEVRHLNFRFLIRHYGFQVENDIFWTGLTGSWEKTSLDLWLTLSRDARVILDVGANTGVYSLVSKAVNPIAEVHAFEPVDRIKARLMDNCALNGFDIKCHGEAVSNTDGKGTIYDPRTDHLYSVTVNSNYAAHQNAVPTEINTIRLDTFFKDHDLKRLDLIKIDVETHEPEVIAGMGFILATMKPTILIELLNDEVARRVEKLIDGLGYLYFDIAENHPPKRVERLTKSSGYNYLICTEETARRLRLI